MRTIPSKITAGVSFSVTLSVPDYGGGWDALLFLRGPSAVDLAGVRTGQNVTFSAPGVETKDWAPGVYAYTIRATDGADVIEVGTGTTTITADLASLPAGTEVRSPSRIALEAIEAVLSKRATMDQERYRINNRELYRTSIGDLIKLRAHYKQLVREEECCSGGGRFGSIKVGFRPVGR